MQELDEDDATRQVLIEGFQLDRLLNIGFRRVGRWVESDDGPSYQIDQHGDDKDILYAFLVDGEVMYVGKTIRRLKRRMYNYKKPSPSQSTSARIRQKIETSLKAGAVVDIFALPDNGLLNYGVFRINLADGLEGSIIGDLKPPWNIIGSKTLNSTVANAQELENASQVDDVSGTPTVSFKITLGTTYYHQGFFNVPAKYSEYLGGDGEPIEAHLKPIGSILTGYINRTANQSGAARLMIGKNYTQWVQKYFDQGDNMSIEIGSKNRVVLSGGT
jgi:hypothetical protein